MKDFNELFEEFLTEAADDIVGEIQRRIHQTIEVMPCVEFEDGKRMTIAKYTNPGYIKIVKAKLADKISDELCQRYFGEERG